MVGSLPRLPALPASVPAGKLPGWDLSRTVHRACPVCGAEAATPICIRPDALEVSRCGQCAMHYLADIPTDKELERFYARYAGYKGYQPKGAIQSWLTSWLDPLVRILDSTGGVAGRSILEVGSSYGTFLERCRRRGATPLGAVELDADARAHLSRTGIRAEPDVPTGAEWDVICAFQVLEHLTDPAAMVAKMASALKPDGRLLLAVPNGGELEVTGPTWVGFRVDLEHLNYFSSKTLAQLLSQHGLFVEQFWLHTQPAITRGDGAASSGLARLQQLGTKALHKAAEWTRLVPTGTFVLTLLARRV